MGPGRVISTGEGSMTTLESWHWRAQGSLQLLASGVGPQGWQRLLQAMGVVWRVPGREGVSQGRGMAVRGVLVWGCCVAISRYEG